jgi:hypothetical protein
MSNASNASALLMLGEVIAVWKKNMKAHVLADSTQGGGGNYFADTLSCRCNATTPLPRVLRQQQPPRQKKTITLGALLGKLHPGQI